MEKLRKVEKALDNLEQSSIFYLQTGIEGHWQKVQDNKALVLRTVKQQQEEIELWKERYLSENEKLMKLISED